MSATHLSEACQIMLNNLTDQAIKAGQYDQKAIDAVIRNFVTENLDKKKPNGWQMINEYLINAMLSGTGTPVVNFIGNAVNTLAKPTIEVIKTAFGSKEAKREARAMFSSLFEGLKADLAFLNNGVRAGLPVDFQLSPKKLGMNQKQFEEFAEAAGARIDPRTNIIVPEDANAILDQSYDYITKAIPGKAGEVIRFPTRLTIGIDEYFKARLRNQKTMAMLSRKASMDETAGKGSYDELFEQYKKKAFDPNMTPEERMDYASRLEGIFGDSPVFDTAIFDIRNYATDGTFQTKLTGGMEAVSKFRGEGNTLGSTLATQVLPFLRTPWNLAKEGVSYVPGLGVGARLAGLTPGTTKTTVTYHMVDGMPVKKFATEVVNMTKEELVSRQLMGLGVVAGLGALYNEGRLTGSIPDEPAERERWKANGVQPFSIKVNDKWVSYQRVEPFATVMGLAADTFAFGEKYNSGKIRKSDAANESLATMYSSLKTNILDKTFMQGFADMSGALQSDKELMTYFANVAKRAVPALSAQIARVADPYERQLSGRGNIIDITKEKLQQRIPGLREQLPPAYAAYSQDPEGDAKAIETNKMQALLGIGVADEPTEFQQRMHKLGISFAPKSAKMGNIELDSQQLSDYKYFINQQATRTFGGALLNLEKLPNDQIRQTVAKNIMGKIAQGARYKLMAKYPDLRDEIIRESKYKKYGLEE